MLKTLSVNVLLSDDASVAEATGPTHNSVGEVKGKGAAKRHPKDSPDETVGFNLAVARALRDLAEKYEKRADEAMTHPPLKYVSYDPGTYKLTDFTYTTPLQPNLFYTNKLGA